MFRLSAAPGRAPRAALFSLALTSAVSLAACGTGASDEPSSPDGLKVAFANVSNQGAVFKPLSDAFENGAETLGWSVEVYDNNTDAATTVNNAKLMAASDADVLVNWVSVAGVEEAVGKIFADSGKPCISIQVEIPGCPVMRISDATYGTGMGEALSAEALERGWTAENTTYVSVSYGTGGKPPLELVSASAEAFSANFDGMDEIAAEDIKLSTTKIGDNFVQIDGDGKLETSASVVRDALQSIPKGRHLVFGPANDDSALGALSAAEAAGWDADDVIVASTGSSPNALAALRENPSWVAEGAVYFPFWAAYAYAMADAVVNNDAELPDLTQAPQNVVTKADVDEYFDGTDPIKVPPIADSATYLLEDSDVIQRLGLDD